MMHSPVVVSSAAEALAVLPSLTIAAAAPFWVSGPEEGDTVDLTVLVCDDEGEEVFEVASTGNIETDKDLGAAIVEALNASVPPSVWPPVKRFTFDMKLRASITVEAPDATTAAKWLADALNCADTNFGAYPNGDPILGEVSLDGAPVLMVDADGEAPAA